jgi:small subunit ribosomal protein S15
MKAKKPHTLPNQAYSANLIKLINNLRSGHWLRDKPNDCSAENTMLTNKQKTKVTKEVKRHEKDTGSPEYQIALFTERIKQLTKHLQKNKKDFHSRRGLLKMVAKRRKLMAYLEKTNEKEFKKLSKKLGLK